MLRLRDSLPCTTLYSRCHKLSNFNLSALQRETIRSRPELVKVTPGAPAAPKETGAPWKIDLGRGLSVHFVVRLRKSVLARRICDGHFGRLCGWLSINLFSTRPPSLSSFFLSHKKPGMKKFSLCVPKTFDFCFFTLGP